MRIYTKLVLDMENGAVVKRECYEYVGLLAECASGSSSKSKSKNQSQQSSLSESGTKYNEDFMKRAMEFANATPQDSGNPTYNPQYVGGAYTPGAYTGSQFTSVAPEGFAKLENSLYATQQSKLKQAYDQATAQQREQLAQSGALNSPSQFLEGSARSSLDRTYVNNLQQAARDAFQGRLGMETSEAGRKTAFDLAQAQNRTGYDVGQGAARTAFDTGEATRQTAFNEQTAAQLLDTWLKKLGVAIEAGRYSTGQSQGTSYGTSSSSSGQGGIQLSGTS